MSRKLPVLPRAIHSRSIMSPVHRFISRLVTLSVVAFAPLSSEADGTVRVIVTTPKRIGDFLRD
jgi:hypothetical protein